MTRSGVGHSDRMGFVVEQVSEIGLRGFSQHYGVTIDPSPSAEAPGDLAAHGFGGWVSDSWLRRTTAVCHGGALGLRPLRLLNAFQRVAA